VSGPRSSHIPFPVFLAALRAERLAWILEHAGQITMSPEYEIEVYELIAKRDPQHLLPGAAEFAQRSAARRDRAGLGR
jgi:hypothetical protein